MALASALAGKTYFRSDKLNRVSRTSELEYKSYHLGRDRGTVLLGRAGKIAGHEEA